MVNAEDKINKILKELTGTYENLLSLRDDIWIGLDHSSIEKYLRYMDLHLKKPQSWMERLEYDRNKQKQNKFF